MGFNAASFRRKNILILLDSQGKEILEVYNTVFLKGEKKYFFDASELSSRLYTVSIQFEQGVLTQKIVIK